MMNRPKAFFTWLFLSVNVKGFECLQREKVFKLSTPEECQTEQIGEPWLSASQLTCSIECSTRLQDNCQSVVYNPQTRLCTPGSAALRSQSFIKGTIPSTGSTDRILFAKQPVPTCNAAAGYQLYEMCGMTLCLYKGPKRNRYFDARTLCAAVGGRIFQPDTKRRLAMFWQLGLEQFNYHTWAGLNDFDEEGTYVWENGEVLSAEQDSWIWTKWEPNNAWNKEDCVEARHPEALYRHGLGDNSCYNPKHYFCEPSDS